MIFQNEKMPFQAIKTRSSKSRKMDIFPKGLVHGFGPKLAIFPPFFLGNIGQENVFYYILERKNASLGYKNKKYKKLKNGHFSKGVSPQFWSKTGHFSTFLFQAIQARKMCFMIFQNQKTPVQAIKTASLKSRKNNILPEGLVHNFGPKLAIFPACFFRQSGPAKCVL